MSEPRVIERAPQERAPQKGDPQNELRAVWPAPKARASRWLAPLERAARLSTSSARAGGSSASTGTTCERASSSVHAAAESGEPSQTARRSLPVAQRTSLCSLVHLLLSATGESRSSQLVVVARSLLRTQLTPPGPRSGSSRRSFPAEAQDGSRCRIVEEGDLVVVCNAFALCDKVALARGIARIVWLETLCGNEHMIR